MSVGKHISHGPHAQYLRSSVRLNSRVRIQVEWTEKGETHSVDAYTVDISEKGCSTVVPQGFCVGQKLRLKNTVNGAEAPANIIWRGHEGRAGWEFGLELEGPDQNFWGVEF